MLKLHNMMWRPSLERALALEPEIINGAGEKNFLYNCHSQKLMNIQDRNRRTKAYVTFRMIFDISMGVLYVLGGLFILFAQKFGIHFYVEVSSVFLSIFGGMLIAYGAFRVYRGIKHIF